MRPLTNSADLVPHGEVHLYAEVAVGEAITDHPVLLLSEAEAPSTRWPDRLIEGFSELGHAVIRFDTRDVGRSSWVEEPYSLADLVDDARAVLDHYDVPAAHVIGRSMGGIIAQHLAMDSPDRIRTLSLISTTPGRREVFGLPDQWLIERMTERLFDDLPESVVDRVEWVIDQLEWFSGPLFDFDRTDAAREVYGEVVDMWRGHNSHGMAVVEATDRFDELTSIVVPAMVVHGTADPVYPVAHGQALAGEIPTARLHLIEGLGHDLPREFVPQLLELFSGLRDEAR